MGFGQFVSYVDFPAPEINDRPFSSTTTSVCYIPTYPDHEKISIMIRTIKIHLHQTIRMDYYVSTRKKKDRWLTQAHSTIIYHLDSYTQRNQNFVSSVFAALPETAL